MLKYTFCCLLLLFHLPMLAQESTFFPVKTIDKEAIQKMAANNLADVLKFELNVEVENAPELGGSRSRVFDLNSRYFKILIDGIPLTSSDMFGSHVDLTSISMYNVSSIEISYAGMGIEYGGGTLAGVVNIITDKRNTRWIRFSLHEEGIGKEYNLQSGNGAKGRHLQNLGINYPLSKNFQIGLNVSRDQFNGYWGKFNGKNYISEPSNERGYEWSPRTTWDIGGSLVYTGDRFSASYVFTGFSADLTFYGHRVEEEFTGNPVLPVYLSEDFNYVNNRSKHHLNLKGNFWQDADYSLDLSLQEASNKRKIATVDAADHAVLNDASLLKLYATNTIYSRAKLNKPLIDRKLIWTLGYELDRTNGYVAVAPGTYMSEEIDRNVFSFAGFTQLQWSLPSGVSILPGLRWSQNQFSKSYFTPAIHINYDFDERNNVKLIAEKLNRFPNHRELFTSLESEFSVLEGNTDLKPETGTSLLVSWQNKLKNMGSLQLQTNLTSSFKQLKNRIIIAGAPIKNPMQDAYRYSNMNLYSSWLNKLEVTAAVDHLKMAVGFSVLGTKGTDAANAKEYDKYLFHAQANSSISYLFNSGLWLNANYRFVGKQPLYSFERDIYTFEKQRVYNRTPVYNLLDLNGGYSFLKKSMDLSLGIRNLFNVKEVNYEATDEKDHYRGDLRTQYISTGRTLYLRITYLL